MDEFEIFLFWLGGLLIGFGIGFLMAFKVYG